MYSLGRTLGLLCVAICLMFGCTNKELQAVPEINSASLPNLFKDPEGNVHVSYVTTNDDVSSLWLAPWEQGAWGESELVASGNNWFVNWADFPSVVREGNKYYAHWLEKNGHGTYAYGVRYSIKTIGQEWSSSQWLHTDNSATEHGFVSLEASTDGVHAVWLDGRNMQSGGHAAHSEHTRTQVHDEVQGMTLRYAFVNNQAQVIKRTLLDDLSCDCCQTAMVETPAGVVIAYRDRVIQNQASEIRDIKILHNYADEWKEASNAPVDNWNIQACPVNGPVLSAWNNNLALAWFTAADDTPKVQLAISNDGGRNFQNAIIVDDSNNLGRVAVDWLNSETIFITWIGMEGSNTALLYRIVSTNGSVSAIQTAAKIDMARSSGVPQVVQIENNKVLLTWTKTGEQPSIQSKVIVIN